MKPKILWQDIVSSTVGYIELLSLEVTLTEHESDDQPTLSERFQVDALCQMSLFEPAIQHQPEVDTNVHNYLLVWLKEMMLLQKTFKGNVL